MTQLTRSRWFEPPKLLWIDCRAGAIVGVLVLILLPWLSELHQLPRSLLLFTGIMNLVYASYSFSLARRPKPALVWINILAAGNLFWAVLCFRWAFLHADTASFLGMVHLVGEGIFVGGLGLIEWKYRRLLSGN